VSEGDRGRGFESLLERLVPGAGRSSAFPPAEEEAAGGVGNRKTHSTLGLRVVPQVRSGREPRLREAHNDPRAVIDNDNRERLAWAASQFCLLFLIAYGLFRVTYTDAYLGEFRPGASALRDHGWPVRDLVALYCVTRSLGVFLAARGKRIPGAMVVDLGLVYYVLASLGIAAFELLEPLPAAYVPVAVSWNCLWITLYPMVVPCPRGRLVLAALAAASAAPVMFLFTVAVWDYPMPRVPALVWVLVPPYLCALLTAYPAQVIHRLEDVMAKARELGAYQLVETLGSGGMGQVWKARHRFLARAAAIKLVRPENLVLGSDEFRKTALERFEREAQTTASLRSPHTVELYDFGVAEDGSFYYVMELLQGLDLEAMVREFGPQPPERVVHLLLQVSASLAEAHAAGLVHRDIKPGNLVACRYGLERDFMKVLDFGLVRHTAAPREDRLTEEGVATGTPAYMAPEAARGDLDLDHRADLYSLGCVAYWLLTGQTVFQSRNGMAMLLEHMQSDPVPPSQRGVTGIPVALEAAVMRLLEKDPAKRPQSAEALMEALRKVPLDSPWTPQRAAGWWQSHGLEGGPDV